MHQNRAPLQISIGKEAAMGRQRGNAEGGANLVRCIGRQKHCVAGWHGNEFSCGSRCPAGLRLEDPDTLADPCRRNARANRLDHAGAVLMRNDTLIGHR